MGRGRVHRRDVRVVAEHKLHPHPLLAADTAALASGVGAKRRRGRGAAAAGDMSFLSPVLPSPGASASFVGSEGGEEWELARLPPQRRRRVDEDDATDCGSDSDGDGDDFGSNTGVCGTRGAR